jgi:hypothetical protein
MEFLDAIENVKDKNFLGGVPRVELYILLIALRGLEVSGGGL